MLNISETTHNNLYYNLDDCVAFCKEIVPVKTESFTDFHMFWNVGLPFERKQALAVKSFLCTQDTSSNLNVWCNQDLSGNPFFRPFLNMVKFRIYDPKIEAVGTVLESKYSILNASDSLNWAKGDLFRILVLHKYGGVYCDFDTVFLRDYGPLLGQEFMYKWSFQREMINGAVVKIDKNSQLSNDLMNGIASGPVRPSTTNWSTDLYQKVRTANTNWTVFPCGFFNPEWVIKNPTDSEMSEFIRYPMKKTKYSTQFYDGTFSWHWHNNWLTNIEDGSKWELLERKFNTEFAEKFNAF